MHDNILMVIAQFACANDELFCFGQKSAQNHEIYVILDRMLLLHPESSEEFCIKTVKYNSFSYL